MVVRTSSPGTAASVSNDDDDDSATNVDLKEDGEERRAHIKKICAEAAMLLKKNATS
ncbi:hypothetical protein QJS10_CPA06g00235 [Acorus calamus]|uniref:Uncharacterized protein n=1 Tax=Acorus calamus TaxID=4465 RepID=A0AAV9ESB1_ACOCL|nr:hypothetical protein QJS10_CPA06g00235 [Acorus calamus]